MCCRRLVNTLVSFALIVLSLQSSAEAAIISTGAVLDAPVAASADAARLASRLEELGVAPERARARVASLTPAERTELAHHLDELPAGGDVFGALAFVFLVLLLTDVLGITDLFPFVKRTVNGEKPGAAKAAECTPAATASAQP